MVIRFFFVLLTLCISTPLFSASLDRCEQRGSFCTKIENKQIGEVVSGINEDGDSFTLTIKYKFRFEKIIENGRIVAKNIKNFDIEETKISIKHKLCENKYSCGLQEFEQYLTRRGVADSIMFERAFSRSHDKVVKKVMTELDIDAKPNLINLLISGLKGVHKNLKRPLYIEFVAKNGDVMGWIKVTSKNGKLFISEHLLYDLDYEENKVLITAPGTLGKSDFIRDTIYTKHLVKSCVDQVFTWSDGKGIVHQSVKTVCRYETQLRYH